jgi:hypothetical protein
VGIVARIGQNSRMRRECGLIAREFPNNPELCR